MRKTVNVITPPVNYPVEPDDMVRMVRLDTSNPANATEVVFLEDLIGAATAMLEEFTCRAFMTQTLEMIMMPEIKTIPTLAGPVYGYESLPDCFRIWRPPCQLVTGVCAVDQAGVSHTQLAANYTVNLNSKLAVIQLAETGTWDYYNLGYYKVRYIAGYGDTVDKVPPQIRQAIRVTVAQWYANREDLDYTIPVQATNLLNNLTLESWDL